jgi:hypothetical protein
MLGRALPVVLALAVLPSGPARAQVGGVPKRPNCQELLSYRDEVAKHGQAIQAASQKEADPEQLCKLFKAFTSAESKMLKALEERRASCGVPAQVIRQVKEGHGKSTQVAKQVCDAAAQGGPVPLRPLDAQERTPNCDTLWGRLSCPWPDDR